MSQDFKSKKEAWWQPAMVIFSQITGLIAGPMIIALYIGRWLDSRYQTEPWLFLASMGVAFIVSSAGIVVITLKYIKDIEEKAQLEKKAVKPSEDFSTPLVSSEQEIAPHNKLNNEEELNKEKEKNRNIT